jgi:hypothetical protein
VRVRVRVRVKVRVDLNSNCSFIDLVPVATINSSSI